MQKKYKVGLMLPTNINKQQFNKNKQKTHRI